VHLVRFAGSAGDEIVKTGGVVEFSQEIEVSFGPVTNSTLSTLLAKDIEKPVDVGTI
jgi:hypothetical protein